jgi:hypothetical protein
VDTTALPLALTQVATALPPALLTLTAAVSLACASAWLGNRLVVPRCGPVGGPALAAPAVEEAAKTLWAVALGAPVLMVHIGFGLVEGVRDLFYGSARRTGAPVWPAFIGAILEHTVFGLATVSVARAGGAAWGAGAAVAFCLHAGWNYLIARVSRREGGR